ncbi:MAG: response regulator [Chloroflexota bacterium]
MESNLDRAMVLVVDDDPSILGLIVDILDSEGYSVVSARNGAEALREVRRAHPDIVLLDMQMPVLDGWEFMQLVHDSGLQFPVMIMTAGYKAAKVAADVGATDYVGKPFELDELLSKLAQHLH